MATSYVQDPSERGELTPKLEGNKVVFYREDEDAKKSSKDSDDDSNQPQTVDADEGAARGEKPKAARSK